MTSSLLKNMPAHGGQIRQVMQHFPEAPKPFIDLSTGISPYAYPVDHAEMGNWTRLPEVEEEEALRQAAAQSYGVSSSDMIVAGPGTQMLIALLPLVLKIKHVTIFGPTYSGHEQSWRNAGATVSIVTDLQSFEASADQQDHACVVCNPNNPDGRHLSITQLRALLNRCAKAGSRLIVDEAFADFETESAVSLLPESGMIVLRSFGKSFGLPGVRLGFLIASDGVASQIRTMMGDWAVSAPAIFAGRQALGDTAWLGQIRASLETDSARLNAALARAGLAVHGYTRLFTLVRSERASDLWAFLCKKGIVTRAFPQRPMDLRFGLPRSEMGWQRLEGALSEWGICSS
ncbi:threonine-phosphate decarboxylase CobD [Gluconobacter thailandicus]|uniref:threonine-phosphate decarboxylase n=1 Tax=Gluconobacter thailandicus TaxID=257438 RepID=A0AAP9JIK3_GLUTH|nr:threonine-phosphate decarboxylase CobD [Gluconobacter thailandicus]QEH97070.1 threonine-phosphate decarboxylase [Gluconobacter thailandicus]